MAGSFLSSSHCHGPQENGVSETGIPGWLTSLAPRESLLLHWNPGPCWTGGGLAEQPGSTSPRNPFPAPLLPCAGSGFPGCSPASAAPAPLLGHSPAAEPAPGTVHTLPGFRSHRLATLGEEILWLALNKLVQLLEALWLLGA